jgi:hypothetical protein
MVDRRKECAVLICSCDAYSDLWDPFFKILHDEWSDKPEEWRVILNTETKEYINSYYHVETMGIERTGRKLTWSNRFFKTLKKIDTEYVLIILDDYFQEKKIEQSRIDEVINWMNKNSDIAVFYFSNIQDMDKFHIRDNKYEGFELNEPGCPYCVCAQTGIWRRKCLMRYLCKYEDVWQFEELASERAGYYKYKIYSAIKDSDYIFRHRWEEGGALRGGKWSQYVPALLEEHGINVNYSKRGFYFPESDGNPSVPEDIGEIKRLFRPPFFRRMIKNIRGK